MFTFKIKEKVRKRFAVVTFYALLYGRLSITFGIDRS